ncbi:MAG TPA: RNA polymerase sigma factor [Planctomycetota bacterium]|nr:RNA polymerase sigma factor [Planctomycetota bacterium]
MTGCWDQERDPLEALRAGDPGPFEAFVETHTITFLGYFRRHGAGPGEAEDLVQETFLKLFRNVHSYQPTDRFAAYAFRVARNAWIDRQRRRATAPGGAREGSGGPTQDSGDEGGGVPETRDLTIGPLERAQRREEADRIRWAVRELGEAHRSVFELAVIEGLPYCEISALLEIPEGTVKSRMHHALRKLRGMLESDSSGGPA